MGSNKKTHALAREYKYQNSLLYAIQALTNQQTHEILTVLVDEANKHLNNSHIDVSQPFTEQRTSRWACDMRAHKYIYYPGTQLYIGLYMVYDGQRSCHSPYTKETIKSTIKYNFKLPSSSTKLTEVQFDEYIADGMLCDVSKDIDELNLKNTLTKSEKEEKTEIAKLKRLKTVIKRKAVREAKKAAKKANKII